MNVRVRLARELKSRPVAAARVFQAVVVGEDGATVDLGWIDGAESAVLPGVRFLASYSPSVGDTVQVLWQGTDGFVLGRLT